MSDPAGHELLALDGFAVAIELVLVDVARCHELVTSMEPGVGTLGGGLEHHQLAELRVELGERTVGFLAPLLDTGPARNLATSHLPYVTPGAVGLKPCLAVRGGSVRKSGGE